MRDPEFETTEESRRPAETMLDADAIPVIDLGPISRASPARLTAPRLSCVTR